MAGSVRRQNCIVRRDRLRKLRFEPLEERVLLAVLPGDYNADGFVDAADYTVWRNHLGEGDETNINNNGDGIDGVDVGDYALWKQHYGDTAPMNLGSGGIAGAVVPEPASVTLLLLAVCSTLSGAIGRRGRFAGE